MDTEIKINLALVSAKVPLCALADVILCWPGGDLTIRRCAVFEKRGEPAWATLPRIPVEKNGKKREEVRCALIRVPLVLRAPSAGHVGGA
jgi:hypothetical protein